MVKFLSIALLAIGASGAVLAHDAQSNLRETVRPSLSLSDEQKSFGREGDPKQVARTVTIDMSDAMRFSPPVIAINQGETVRFLVKNSGKAMHEMVIGSMKDLREHAEMMKKHPGMEHDEPYMAHVAPGKTGKIVWQFNRAGSFHLGCLVPGHFEAGMLGAINVKAR